MRDDAHYKHTGRAGDEEGGIVPGVCNSVHGVREHVENTAENELAVLTVSQRSKMDGHDFNPRHGGGEKE